MKFLAGAPRNPSRLGILSGAFNPPTRAHLALARAALAAVDEVLFVLPQVFPHRPFEGASFEQRVRMLDAALAGEPRYSVASTERGLFIDIARECREACGAQMRLAFLCGRDAAERIVNWDYGEPGAFLKMLDEFELVVAARQGRYDPPAAMRDRIYPLLVEPGYDLVSSTQVRERIARGERWEELVPEAIVPLVREIYLPPA